MTLWRLEWMRLIRTRRWIALAGVFLFAGVAGPLVTKYLGAILKNASNNQHLHVVVGHQTATDGLRTYIGYVQQFGILTVILIAAAALAIDQRPEAASFLRTRATARQILVPKLAVVAASAIVAWTVGSLLAWYETATLLGGVPPSSMFAGIAYGGLYMLFIVTVVAVMAGTSRSVISVAGLTVLVLVTFSALGLISSLKQWLPNHLLGALKDLPAHTTGTGFLGAATVTATLAISGAMLARWLFARRET